MANASAFRHRFRAVAPLAGTILVTALAACTQGGSMMGEKPMAAAPASLYDRLGGKPAITAVVDDFVGNVAADNRINQRFAHANIPFLKSSLVDQVCQATGGPCQYTGPDMRTVHTGMHITDAEFNDLVEDLQKSLNKFKVPAAEQNELLTALGGMKPDIVGI
jgi:hemoglobin